MTWHPNDLVADADLVAYEAKILTAFNVANWQEKRAKALEDWLFPILSARGVTPETLRTRFEPDTVLGYTAAAYADLTGSAKDATVDDVDLAAVFATPASDALYIGSTQQFRGLSIRMFENVSAVASVLTVSYWADAWTALTITDGTVKTAGKTFSGGGSVTWSAAAATGWVKRTLNGSDPLYFVKLTVSSTPTSAKAGQIGTIRRSALCAPAALRTLALIMREAPTGAAGPWLEKAAFYGEEASLALERALPLVGHETDTDESDQVSQSESEQTLEEVGGGPFRMERG
jgi:hypothetical protein